MVIPLFCTGSSHSGSVGRLDVGRGSRSVQKPLLSEPLGVTDIKEEPLYSFGNVAEFLNRLTSAPLETEEVRTLARAERASDKSFPRNEGRYGSAISCRWVNDGRDSDEDDHGCGCGDEDEDEERFTELDSSLSLSSSTVFRESGETERKK